MASTKRHQNTDLAENSIQGLLFSKPYEFEFRQAARLLHKLYPNFEPLGLGSSPDQEIAAITSSIQLAPSPSDLFSLEVMSVDRPPLMTVNFAGIAGHNGPLPDTYTELILERLSRQDYAFKDFLDVFNHRLVGLSFRIAAKFQFLISYHTLETQPITQIFYAIAGFNQSRQAYYQRYPVPPRAYLRYAGYFWRQARSTVGLRIILQDYFRIPFEIEEFVGMWLSIDEDQVTIIGSERAQNGQLGVSACLGDKSWVQSKKIRIHAQALDYDTFIDLLPNGLLHQKVAQFIASYLPNHMRYSFQLKVRPDASQPARLDGSSQLGWTSWMRSDPKHMDDTWVYIT